MRTLDNIFRTEDGHTNFLFTGNHDNYKTIKSPNTGKRHNIPSHVSDFVFDNDKRKTQFRLASLTHNNWNWERFKTKHRVMVARTHPAIPTYDVHEKEVPSE